jgi:acetylornithine deacetylase
MTSVVEHLSNLIHIPSVSSLSNRAVIEYAEGVLDAAGWKTRRQSYRDAGGVEKLNLVALPTWMSADDREVDIAFVCHTDTVPYAATWEKALVPFETDGFLYGCGSCDVKGFLACILTAVQGSRCSVKAAIVLTADEEIGCVGASKLIASESFRMRRMVIGEPTSLHAARAGKGYCLASVRVVGAEAHSAHPEKGASAISGAAHLLVALEEYGAEIAGEQNAIFSPPFTTLNVGTIQGGTAKNIIPGECSFLVEWRPIPGNVGDGIAGGIAAIIAHEQKLHPRLSYEFKVLREQRGFEVARDAGLVQQLETLSGRAATSIPFGSEASLFAPLCDEIVVFGPGDMTTAHSDRECVEIAQLHEAVGIVEKLMLSSCG